METGPSTYTLNAWQFEQALAILQREQQANTQSARQEKLFKLLNSAIYGLGITYLTHYLLIVVMWIVGLDPKVSLDFEVDTKLGIVFRVLVIINSIASIILAAGITTLFFLNLPYVSRLLRQRKLARQLGLWEALRAPWKTERRQNKLRNVSDLGILILGLLVAVGSLAILRFAMDFYDWFLWLCSLVPCGRAAFGRRVRPQSVRLFMSINTARNAAGSPSRRARALVE